MLRYVEGDCIARHADDHALAASPLAGPSAASPDTAWTDVINARRPTL